MSKDKQDSGIVKVGNNGIVRYSNALVRRGIEEINEKLSRQTNNALQVSELGINWVSVEGGPTGDFYISATTVTFDQYDKFCDATGYKKPKADFGRGKQPVINVNVADAVAFCNWLSKETGTTIRLPEENEWEYAAKGGIKSKGFMFWSGSNNIDEVAWYDDNSGKTSHKVATKKPNELGIYDMSGNVWELCGTLGANRGGSYFDGGVSFRRDFKRDVINPDGRFTNRGFRVVQKK